MAIKYLCAGVDGTDSRIWRRRDGANSHIFRFVHDFRADGKIYWHGPDTFGMQMDSIIEGWRNVNVTRLTRPDVLISGFVSGRCEAVS